MFFLIKILIWFCFLCLKGLLFFVLLMAPVFWGVYIEDFHWHPLIEFFIFLLIFFLWLYLFWTGKLSDLLSDLMCLGDDFFDTTFSEFWKDKETQSVEEKKEPVENRIYSSNTPVERNISQVKSNADLGRMNVEKEEVRFQERKIRIDNHVSFEGRISPEQIRQIKGILGYKCMGCGFEVDNQEYRGILEAHHKMPYSQIGEGETRVVRVNDFLILCPTCHKLIHKLEDVSDLDALKKLLKTLKKY